MEDWSNSSRVILFVVLENFVLLCRYLVGLALPAVPYSVQLLKKQQDVIVRRPARIPFGDHPLNLERYGED